MTNDVRQVVRTQRGKDCAQRIYDIIERDDFNPDHATDIRQVIEEALSAQPSEESSDSGIRNADIPAAQPSEVERPSWMARAKAAEKALGDGWSEVDTLRERAEKAEADVERLVASATRVY